MTTSKLKLLILGAHPDDAEIHAGGLMTLYRRHGHDVKVISVTNGESGHQSDFGPPLTRRRREELAHAAAVIGAMSEAWDFRDGRLEPTLELRWKIIAELRQFAPDLVLTHRTSDYHPDHRAVGQAVQDASYLVTVPAVVPEVPHLKRDPVVAYMPDHFTKPRPFEPNVAIDVEPVLDEIVRMLACHRSQVFDWLPYNRGIADQVPPDDPGRLAWLAEWFKPRVAEQAERFRQRLVECYGAARAASIRYAEGFEVSEYAGAWNAETRQRLFGFLF